jgi:hypothetical protein
MVSHSTWHHSLHGIILSMAHTLPVSFETRRNVYFKIRYKSKNVFNVRQTKSVYKRAVCETNEAQCQLLMQPIKNATGMYDYC